MSPLYKLKDYKETFKFEKEHPEELRWDNKYKMYMLTEDKKIQGIWLKDKSEIVGEILLTWQSTSVVHVESFTVLPSHRSIGLGHDLVKLAIEWATNSDYKHLTGEARKGASWKVFENFGAEEILIYQNWGGTKEDYISFKIDL
jgi:GNAT superfamily N-acetyltransferase